MTRENPYRTAPPGPCTSLDERGCGCPRGNGHAGECDFSIPPAPSNPRRRWMHMAQSVDADRFDDRYLRKHVLPAMTHEGKPVTVKQFRAACAEARAKGLEVFPPCDHTDATGMCLGHEQDDEDGT